MPVVGYIMMPGKSVALKEVLISIKENAFVTSLYPVIIHLELQCRSQYQEKAIEIINEILGDTNILILPEGMTEEEVKSFPSPCSLKKTFMLKCIRPRFTPKKVKASDDLLVNDPTETGQLGMLNGREEYLKSSIIQRLQQEEPEEVKSSVLIQAESIRMDNSISPKKPEKQLQKIMVAEKLTKNICLITGMKLDLKKLRYPWEVASISASKMEFYRQENKEERDWLHYTTKRIAAVIPTLKIDNGKVVDYKIIDPMLMWKLGLQMVGLFRGIKNDGMAMNDMLFYQGGNNSGYVLKHHRLIYPNKHRVIPSLPSIIRRVKMKFLSINQIPLIEEFNNESTFTLKVNLKGAKCDEKGFEVDFKSEGFNYLFEADGWEIEFKITYPLEAVFTVTLYYKEAIICRAVFPAISIRQGYRNIPLCDKNYRGYAFSNIVGKFEIDDVNT